MIHLYIFGCSAGDLDLIPGSGIYPGEGKGYPLQYSGLENSMDRGAWQATVHGAAKESDRTERHSLAPDRFETLTCSNAALGSTQSHEDTFYPRKKQKFHGSDSEESSCSEGYLGSIPGLGRSPGEGNGYPLQYSGLENSMDRETWRATVYCCSSVAHLCLIL